MADGMQALDSYSEVLKACQTFNRARAGLWLGRNNTGNSFCVILVQKYVSTKE